MRSHNLDKWEIFVNKTKDETFMLQDWLTRLTHKEGGIKTMATSNRISHGNIMQIKGSSSK